MAARRKGPDSQLGFDFGVLPVPRNTPPPPPPPLPDEATPLERALRLESNLALFAGAGAGKTHSLVTLCLHVLAGARRDREPIAAANLCLLTFTEKAAGEMRQRLRERLDRLATGTATGPRRELELETSFAALGRSMPPPKFWRAIRDDLGAASIGTFHSVMAQVLRRAPAGSGVNPAFELMEDREAKLLFGSCVERVVLDRLEADDPIVRELVRDFGFGADSQWGLVTALVRAAAAIREEGVRPDLVPVQAIDEAREAFLASIRGLRLMATSLQRTLGVRDAYRDRVDEICRRLAQVTLETWPEHRGPIDRASMQWRRQDTVPLRDALRGSDGQGGPGALWMSWRMAPADACVRELIGKAIGEYEKALDERGALDFTGLLVRARELLRTSPEARRDAHRRFQAVLVDEFQDTNRVQLELVCLLAEQRDGAPRPLSFEIDRGASNETVNVPLEPGLLAVVGDRKQAIYDFRGADVAVFELMARAIELGGGQRQFLQSSRRSTHDVVELCNAQSGRFLMRDDVARKPYAFEVEFDVATDALQAVRTDAPKGPALIRLGLPAALNDTPSPSVEQLRLAESDALARLLAEQVSNPANEIVSRAEKQARPVRGGDIAVLFQRFTQLEVYRQALVRHGVRHRIVRGRGFYAAQEVVDLASFLALLADPSLPVAFAAVLRSPLVGLSDTALVSLALDGEQVRGLSPRRVLLSGELDGAVLDDAERARLERFLAAFRVLFAERDRLTLSALLRLMLELLDVRVVTAAGPFGEQALANLDKLLELAVVRSSQGMPLPQFARELLELADTEPREAQGDVLDDGDPEAVTLLTVHQAKGLEWPVVVLPELFVSSPPGGERVRFDRDVGLAVSSPSTEPTGSARSLQCKTLKSKRDEAQRRRLLYVALTRARDRVIVGLIPPKPQRNTWASWLKFDDFWWQQFHDRGASLDVDSDALPPGRPPSPPGEVERHRAEVTALIARAQKPVEATTRDVLLPVTQVQDFVTCPRRFQLAHQIGLSESPYTFEWSEEPDTNAGPGDPRQLGTATHKLLELAPLSWLEAPDQLEERLRTLQSARGLETDREADVVTWAHRFFSSPYGSRLHRARRVLRELPFVLRLGDDTFSLHMRGQIDLLVIDERVEVIDYKTSFEPQAGLTPYTFQLGCYVLAAKRFVQAPDIDVRAGISFLRESSAEPKFLSQTPDADTLERELVEHAKALVTAQRTGVWGDRPRTTCVELGCGFVARCHGSP